REKGLATTLSTGRWMVLPLSQAGGLTHWQSRQTCPPEQSVSASHASLPHTIPSPHTSVGTQWQLLQVVQAPAQSSPGSPHCSPGSIVPSPQVVATASGAHQFPDITIMASSLRVF